MSIHFTNRTLDVRGKVKVRNLLPRLGEPDIIRDILRGLTAPPRRISSMFFYDTAGSRLFEKITRLPEYYLTRTEKTLLAQAADVLCPDLRDTDIVEIGSGNCVKISILLRALRSAHLQTIRYLPVDVSRSALEAAVADLQREFPQLEMEAVVADITRQMDLIPRNNTRMFCFFGSTLGNLTARAATGFMKALGKIMHPGEILLLGLDMVKDRSMLEEAYNDRRGVTAAFNRNILRVVNRLAETDFDPGDFDHLAFYNPRQARIEMHLRARRDVEVCTPHLAEKIRIRKSETIHTEHSHKFTLRRIRRLAAAGKLAVEEIFTDPHRWFSLVQFQKKE